MEYIIIPIYIYVKHIWYIITSGMIFWDQEYMILYMESSVFSYVRTICSGCWIKHMVFLEYME